MGIERQDVQSILPPAARSRQEDTLAHDNGAGQAPAWQVGTPGHILIRAQFLRQRFTGNRSGAAGTAKPWPIGGRESPNKSNDRDGLPARHRMVSF
jgi:hypothetical protein